MQEHEFLSSIIEEIYDAALDSSRWASVLAKTRDFVGGYSAALFAKDATQKKGSIYYDDGVIDDHYKQLYFEKYIKLDPATTSQFCAEIGQPISTEDIIAYEEFLETRIYREWAKPQGLVDFATAVLDKSATAASLIGIFRHERDGLVDSEVKRRLRLLIPHLRRALLIGKVIDFKSAVSESLIDTLDGLTAAMFLVDENRMVIHANASGHVMAASGEVLRISKGRRLAGKDSKSHHALGEALKAAARGDSAMGIKGIAIPLSAPDGKYYVAHVMPLSSDLRSRATSQYHASAAVFVHKAVFQVPAVPEVIAKHYQLTPAELRVLLTIVQVGSVPETAEALGVADSTIKTHLHRVFDKTGTSRQSDLVKLLAAFNSPLIEQRHKTIGLPRGIKTSPLVGLADKLSSSG